MDRLNIRRAAERDIPALNKLLYEVHKIHSDVRPDLFRSGAKKYTDEQLRAILADDSTPVFVAEREGEVVGYAFCALEQFVDNPGRTEVKTLYIDDLCVDVAARGAHVGTRLYEFVLDYARKLGCYNVTLNVWEGNQNALQFYRKIGMHVQKNGMETIL